MHIYPNVVSKLDHHLCHWPKIQTTLPQCLCVCWNVHDYKTFMLFVEMYFTDLSMHACSGASDCERVMQRGWNNRATGSTMMNSESSRSHSIFTIFMERCDQDDKGEEHIRAAKLNLVDLAGSERQAKTGA